MISLSTHALRRTLGLLLICLSAWASGDILMPTADSWVNSNNVTQNNGGNNNLQIENTTKQTDAYLKFDTTSISNISSAKLRLKASLNNAGSVVSTAYSVADTTWGETTIAWFNKPALGTVLGSITVVSTSYAWFEIDVTAYVQSEFSVGRKVVSFAYHNNAISTPLIKANSRESSSPPQLLINYNYNVPTAPDAPTIGTAIAGNAQATVTFTPPANDGGSPITSYTVTSNPRGRIGTCTASPCIVMDLTNGAIYTFTVTATNAVGTGANSALSNIVIPATVPNAPGSVSATGGNALATVTFSPPGGSPPSDGGSPITGYTATSSPQGRTGTCTDSPCVVTGLTNGTRYAFWVTANNAVGSSQPSGTSNFVTPAPIRPDAPTIGIAVGGNTQAMVTFTAPANDGGSPITSYTATSSPQGRTGTCTASPCIVTGLTNDTAYTFTVRAINTVGTSLYSANSNSVKPSPTPQVTYDYDELGRLVGVIGFE